MAFEAELKHGNPIFGNYTPGTAVAAGQVVVIDEEPFVAHQAIAANALGALALRGGIYKVTADANLAPGDKVYWNNTSNKVTATAAAGANKMFGFIVPESDPGADGDACLVLHVPDGSSI